jgi:hypothetical protein
MVTFSSRLYSALELNDFLLVSYSLSISNLSIFAFSSSFSFFNLSIMILLLRSLFLESYLYFYNSCFAFSNSSLSFCKFGILVPAFNCLSITRLSPLIFWSCSARYFSNYIFSFSSSACCVSRSDSTSWQSSVYLLRIAWFFSLSVSLSTWAFPYLLRIS